MGKFVVITGLDASGKDTVAERLHKSDPNSHLIKTPTELFTEIRTEVDLLTTQNPWLHYHFYMASIYHASAIISELLKHEEGNVYCVRYLIDTVCYHRGLGLPVELRYENDILRPDLTIFLAVTDEAVRQKRLEKRVRSAGDEITDDYLIRERIKAAYEYYENEYVKIDNTHKTVSQVVEEVHCVIVERLGTENPTSSVVK